MMKTRWTLLVFVAVAAALGAWGCSRSGAKVVVYTSVDEVEARKVLDAFSRETGIEVLPLFDTEASKTTGLSNRILSEMSRPRADVFWNNELSRTILLAGKGAFAAYSGPSAADIPAEWRDSKGRWASFTLRARVIAYNIDKVSDAEAPKSLEDLCLPRWKNRVGIANPLFGTTACHAAALASLMGEDKALDYFRRLKANGVRVYDGNSVVRDAVASGEVEVGLTDTDDALLGMNDKMKIRMILPDQGAAGTGTLVIPNSVALVAGAPHRKEAERLVDYLLSRAVEKQCCGPSSGQIPVRPETRAEGLLKDFAALKAMSVDWMAVSDMTEPVSRRAADVLLK